MADKRWMDLFMGSMPRGEMSHLAPAVVRHLFLIILSIQSGADESFVQCDVVVMFFFFIKVYLWKKNCDYCSGT